MDANINTLFTNLATTIRNVSVAISVFAFMWGAIQYATSAGSPHQLELGKTAMKAAVIGVGAVVLASTFVGIVFTALGGAQPPRLSDCDADHYLLTNVRFGTKGRSEWM